MQSIAGIFQRHGVADKAVCDLLDAGFNKEDISLLQAERESHRLFSRTEDEATRTALGGATGAIFGGALGALIGGLTAAGSIMLPTGMLLISGPVVAALSGAGAGGVIGGLAGALIEAGFAADDANRYESELKSGKSVVIVRTADEIRASVARLALRDADAINQAS